MATTAFPLPERFNRLASAAWPGQRAARLRIMPHSTTPPPRPPDGRTADVLLQCTFPTFSFYVKCWEHFLIILQNRNVYRCHWQHNKPPAGRLPQAQKIRFSLLFQSLHFPHTMPHRADYGQFHCMARLWAKGDLGLKPCSHSETTLHGSLTNIFENEPLTLGRLMLWSMLSG